MPFERAFIFLDLAFPQNLHTVAPLFLALPLGTTCLDSRVSSPFLSSSTLRYFLYKKGYQIHPKTTGINI
jgi:hypothetical protein